MLFYLSTADLKIIASFQFNKTVFINESFISVVQDSFGHSDNTSIYNWPSILAIMYE